MAKRSEVEYKRLMMVREDINEFYSHDQEFKKYKIGLLPPEKNEDYDIDIPRTGYTDDGKVFEDKVEIKTIGNTYGQLFDRDGFYRTKAARNRAWRYGLTADTKSSQEAINADRTDAPWWARTDKPLHVLNAADKYGSKVNAKLTKLLENRYGVIFIFSDGYLMFSPKDLENAIVGYAWQMLPHTKELGDWTARYELKAVLDMTKYTRWIKKDIPGDLL